MARGKILTQGFLVDVDVPSEERLAVHVDVSGLSDVGHMAWVRALQDLLRSIDVSYKIAVTGKVDSKLQLRRRSVRVRYIKDESGRQVKVATFHPYPSMLVNKLKGIRHRVYDLLNKNCLILQEERIGRMKRKLYFLPANLAADVMAGIGEINCHLRALTNEIADFEDSVSFKEIMAHISKTGREYAFKANLQQIRVSPVPLSLSKEFFMEFLEEEKRKALAEVDERRRIGLEELEREIQRKREEMLEALKRDLQSRFASILAITEEAVKAAMKGGKASGQAAAKRLNELSNLIKSVGVEFDPRPMESLGNVLSAINSRNAEALREAVMELAESLGLQPSGDVVRDMELASRAAGGKSLLLLTID